MTRVWLPCLGALLLCTFLVRTVAAQTSVIIVIQRNSSVEVRACERQLHTELIAEGYSPSSVEVIEEPSATLLVDTAKRLSSPAAISVSLRGGRLAGLVWLVDPDEPGGLLRTIAEQPTGEQAPVVFAVKATNVLEGALLELGYIQEPKPEQPESSPQEFAPATTPLPRAPDPRADKAASAPKPDSVPPRSNKDKPRQRKHNWQLALGADTLLPLAKQPVAYGGSLAFNRRLGRFLALGLDGQAYLPMQAEGALGHVDITQFMAGARFDVRQYLGNHLTVYEFLSAGLYYAKVDGTASAPLRNNHRFASTLYHQLGLGSSWHATADFGIWARASCFLAWKPTDVLVVDETVATLGAPALLLGLGMQVSF